jgi:hypothetical protein
MKMGLRMTFEGQMRSDGAFSTVVTKMKLASEDKKSQW